jgi:hypothetical protein
MQGSRVFATAKFGSGFQRQVLSRGGQTDSTESTALHEHLNGRVMAPRTTLGIFPFILYGLVNQKCNLLAKLLPRRFRPKIAYLCQVYPLVAPYYLWVDGIRLAYLEETPTLV